MEKVEKLRKIDISTLKVGDVLTLHYTPKIGWERAEVETISFKVLAVTGLLYAVSDNFRNTDDVFPEKPLNTFRAFLTAYSLDNELNYHYKRKCTFNEYSYATIYNNSK